MASRNLLALVLFSALSAQNSGQQLPKLLKCCSEGQIYHSGNDTCVDFDSRNISTHWLPPVLNEKAQWVQLTPDSFEWSTGGPKKGQCGPGFDFQQRLFPAWDYATFIVSIGSKGGAARIQDHPERPLVDLNRLCMDRVLDGDEELFIARMCVRSICDGKVCIRKCCKIGSAFIHSNDTEMGIGCMPTDELWKPERYEIHAFSTEKVVEEDTGQEVHFLIGSPPDCKNTVMTLDPNIDKDDAFNIDLDGSLYVPMWRQSTPRDQYCVEKVHGKESPVAFLCHLQADGEAWSMEGNGHNLMIYAALSIVSQMCLLLTFIVYSVLPEMKNLHGKNLLSYVGSLFCAYFFLSTIQLGGNAMKSISKGICRAMGLIVHYLFMVTFFWLSVMSFDLWRTFRSFKAQSGHNSKLHKKRRFLIYSMYSWGSPMLISIVTITMEFAPGISPFYLKPLFAYNRCWFASKGRLFLYFMGPMAVVLLANLVFFILTTLKLLQAMRDTKVLNNLQDNKQHGKNKNRFMLYVKLLVVMGVTWILEVVSWAAGGPSYIWFIPDLFNVLQGVFIFIIFVCKKKVLRKLNERYHLIKNERILQMLSLDTQHSRSLGSQVSNGTITTTSSI